MSQRIWLIDHSEYMSKVSFWATAIEDDPLTRLFPFLWFTKSFSLDVIYVLGDLQ